MAAVDVEKPGFSFENCSRNRHLEKIGLKAPTAYKTGTTIAGIIYKGCRGVDCYMLVGIDPITVTVALLGVLCMVALGVAHIRDNVQLQHLSTPSLASAVFNLRPKHGDGVVLGADTRATEDTIVADKNCSKIHYLADNMYCCGAGTAADTEMTTQMIASQLDLHKLNTGRTPRVATANRLLKQMLFRYQGYISAALVLGGVDVTGPHLYSIHPHGSTDKLPYVTMGSGSLAAMATFEAGFKPNMEKAEALKLVRDAIAAGIFNDLGSGSNIDLCVITEGKVEYLRPYDEANVKGQREGNYGFKRGSTAIISTEVKKIPFDVVSTEVSASAMDTA